METLIQQGFAVKQLCTVLNVSRSAYYAWQNAPESPTLPAQQQLQSRVGEIFAQHRRRYGARRIVAELLDSGEACSRTKARQIMVEMNLVAIQPRSYKPRTTNSHHRLGFSPNLLLTGIAVSRLDQVWVGDITYIPLVNRFAYLAILLDLFSRKIVGWKLALSMDENLVLATLKQAIKARQPVPQLVHHTDRGGQYASTKYRQLLIRARMLQSMSRAGDCYDNALMESCFGKMKTELEMKSYDSLAQAGQEIQDYINYYNTLRRHSALDYKTPTQFELNLNH